MPEAFDYDWLVVGSGFGGSVSALRLAEKGYSVGVLECGRRFSDKDHAKSTWDLKNFLWAPFLGLTGILRLSAFKDIFVLSGSAVGGGSVVYACTLYRAHPDFFRNPQWADLDDWAARLAPHYDTAEAMLGVTEVPFDSGGQRLLRDMGAHFGAEASFRRTPVGIYFGQAGQTAPDPYFGGEGPERTGCEACGACMVGCRVGAKNTLLKNYLHFAEKKGAAILPGREVVDIRPIGAADGSEGYLVTTERPGAWWRKDRRTMTARGVVLAAGALGTNRLLARCKLNGSLPAISDRLGQLVRTNSESILAVTLPDDGMKLWNDVAISASIHPRADTHIECVTYGKDCDLLVASLLTLLTGKGSRLTRPLLWLRTILFNPLTFLKTLWPIGAGRRAFGLLVMQSLDNAIAFKARKGWFGGVRLTTEQNREKPNPTYIELGNKAAEWAAARTGGIAHSMILEALADIPTTAHILGGAVIGKDAGSGVIDSCNRVFGYRNLLVCDGSAMPANPGVNPSLTITALAESAMAEIPAKG